MIKSEYIDYLNSRDIDGCTALYLAAKHGNKELVKLLLAKDVCVNTTDNEGRTAFDISVLCGHKEISKLLLNNGAYEKHYKKQIIELLIQHGAKE